MEEPADYRLLRRVFRHLTPSERESIIHNGDKQSLLEDGHLYCVAELDQRIHKTVSATSNVQGDGTQNSSLSTNGRTSWMEEGDKHTA